MVSGHGSWQRLGTATPSWITEQVCWDGTGMRLSQKKWSQWSQRYTGTPWKVKPEAECNPKVKVLKPADGEQSFKFEKTWKTNCLQVWQMKRKKECPTNKKYVSLMGRESFWMQNCRNRNEIFLYTVTMMHFWSALLTQVWIFHHVEPAMGTNFPSKCHSVFRESIVP